jgi:hypothetical protein
MKKIKPNIETSKFNVKNPPMLREKSRAPASHNFHYFARQLGHLQGINSTVMILRNHMQVQASKMIENPLPSSP